VYSSFPSQNEQNAAESNARFSTLKSLGRLRRSVEMITHRPVTGSFRNSGMKTKAGTVRGAALQRGQTGRRETARREHVQR
jgi:hypothetical protein